VRLLHGKPLAEELHTTSAQRTARLRDRGVEPRLAVVSVGADPAASDYFTLFEVNVARLLKALTP